MPLFLFLFLALLLPLRGGMAAPSGGVLSIGQLPGQKIPESLHPKERNPFTRREIKTAEVATDRESEESKLRAILGAMVVTGVVRGGASDKVLLGSLILEPGRDVPRLLEGQTEHLVVTAITGKEVEIQFVETEARTEPRRILIPIDLRPRVTVRLPILPDIPARPVSQGNRATE
jgi:hypothetical protein